MLRSRLRGGSANTGRGVAGFLRGTFARVRQAEVTRPPVMSVDSGFYSRNTAVTCRKHGVRVSITARMNKDLYKVISANSEEEWTPNLLLVKHRHLRPG